MQNPAEIIIKKRDGRNLSKEEIKLFVSGYINGSIPDYQMAALLMAIFFKGMTDEEVVNLTDIYVNSGKRLSFTFDTVDKHSTGGVGDKISLMLAPIVASCGAAIPMISGRGLGHTGGTLDKLEAIPGFRTALSETEFRRVIDEVGFSIISQSDELVPADKVIYALRDVSGTVESLPLITASIISKKIAEGAKNLVIDLKIGSGAFISDIENGKELGRLLKTTGELLGQRVEVVFSNMNSPLGYYVGNGLEILETIEYLKGKQIPDIDKLTKRLAVKMLLMTNKCTSEEEGLEMVSKAIESGAALELFARFIKAQGGDESVCDDPQLLPQAKYIIPIKAQSTGWVERIDNRKIGYSLVHINAGRRYLNSVIDHSTGVYLEPKIGTHIQTGDLIGKVFCNDKENGCLTARIVAASYQTSPTEVKQEDIILSVEL